MTRRPAARDRKFSRPFFVLQNQVAKLMRRIVWLSVPVVVLCMPAAWRGQPADAAAVTYSKDVAPILNEKCVSCHRPGEVAPMSLRSFEEARPYARAIKEKVASRQMPPWFADPAIGSFSNDPSLTPQEIATISAWVDAGAPQGNPADAPKPPSFTDGWQLGEPDYVVELPEVHIPATGRDYFPTPSLTLDIPQDRWVRAIEVRPSNREVTHHSVIFAAGNPLSLMMGGDGFFDVLAVWAVGTAPTVYPEGTGRWIHKGEMLRTNLHYHPNGTPQVDRTRIGFYFGKGELKKEVAAGLAGSVTFQIPPQRDDYEVRAVYAVDQDIDVISLFPHMHLRGKDMRMDAYLPGGRRQTLLNVPDYDFNWQLFYYPTSRIRLPEGTRIELTAHYDNSSGNKRNPNPDRTIRFGETTNDEMMFGMFEFTAPVGVSPKRSTQQTREAALLSSYPKGTAFVCDVPMGGRSTRLVLHISKPGADAQGAAAGGTAEWLLPLPLGNYNPMPAENVTWSGSTFSFVSEMPIGGLGRGRATAFDVTGTIDADGTVRGRMTSRGPVPVQRVRGRGASPSAAPLTLEFTGRG
jgi:hypothetical protein